MRARQGSNCQNRHPTSIHCFWHLQQAKEALTYLKSEQVYTGLLPNTLRIYTQRSYFQIPILVLTVLSSLKMLPPKA